MSLNTKQLIDEKALISITVKNKQDLVKGW